MNKTLPSFCLHDQHVHSSFSNDSKEEVEEYIKIARDKGCKYFVTTEHLDLNINNSGVDWQADFVGLKNKLDSLKDKYPSIEFLMGIEVGYKIDYMEQNKRVASLVDYDMINLSVHDYLDLDFYFYDNYEKYGLDNTMRFFFEKELEAIQTWEDFDCLCHIDYAFKTLKLHNANRSMKEFESLIIPIFKELVKRDKVLEINTKVQEGINDDNHLIYLLNLYKSCGGTLLTLSSDAHKKERYLSNFDHYKEIIKSCGFNKLCYFVKRKRYYYDI